jgi:hypothetical protein
MTKRKTSFAAQPSVAAILKMLTRARGATTAEIVKARDLKQHSVRVVISRLGTVAHIKISRTPDEDRGLVYRTGSVSN